MSLYKIYKTEPRESPARSTYFLWWHKPAAKHEHEQEQEDDDDDEDEYEDEDEGTLGIL